MRLARFSRGNVSAARIEVPAQAPAPAWSLADLAGRLVELSASAETAHLTAALGLVLEAQLGDDRAAWVALEGSSFFPPDLVDTGIDLDALPVVRVPDARTAGRAADHLLRSNAFGLVVVDLAGAGVATALNAGLPVPLLSRLLGLAREHGAVVLLLTRKTDDAPSMHSLISLRAEARWRRTEAGVYEVGVRVLKDKRSGPGWTHTEICCGPPGLR
jgi:recombination protein RecA